MGYFQDGPISLSMKHFLKINYGLKVMMWGTPTGARCSGTKSEANKNTIFKILWI